MLLDDKSSRGYRHHLFKTIWICLLLLIPHVAVIVVAEGYCEMTTMSRDHRVIPLGQYPPLSDSSDNIWYISRSFKVTAYESGSYVQGRMDSTMEDEILTENSLSNSLTNSRLSNILRNNNARHSKLCG